MINFYEDLCMNEL
jgi:hypothetical protein